MPFEFEALVGHLYIVSGRAISTAPPGTLVEVAPKKAARGRETDTFFTLVLPAGSTTAPTQFYEQMAQKAAERYFSSTGSVTSGLRELFTYLNNNLIEHNLSATRAYEANLICAVLRGRDLIVGRVGPAVTLILEGGNLKTFPEELTSTSLLNTPALGVQPVPDIKLTQFHVMNGTRVAFGDAGLAKLDRNQMQNALMSIDFGTVLVAFQELARLQMSLVAVEFVPPDAPTPLPVPEGESTVEIAERIREEVAKVRKTGEMEVVGEKRPRRPKEIQRKAKRRIGKTALSLAGVLDILSRVINHFLGKKEEGGRGWLSSPLGTGFVVLLPVLVVALVFVLWLSNQGTSAYELCVVDAQDRAALARRMANGDRQTELNAWGLTLEKINECERIRPGSPDMLSIRREGQAVIDGLNQISRHEARVVESFVGAQLTRITMQGNNLYVLDSANGWFYAVSLDTSGMGIVRPGTVLVRANGTIQGVPIAEIVDIAYNRERNVAVVLDRNGVLVECSPRFFDCEARRLPGAENWVNPVAMTIWSDRIYILDTGVGEGQIWRYDRQSGSYSQAPREYFGASGAVRPNLRTAVDFDIDNDGNVFVLLAEGLINKYFNGQPQQFGYAAFPEGQELTGANSFYLDSTLTSQSIYIVNKPRRMIYETSFIGTFNNTYAVFDESNFNLLEAVVVAPGRTGADLVYAVSGNTIWVFEK